MHTLKQFYKIFAALPYIHRKNLIILQILIIISAFFELVGVSSIMPFLSIIISPDKLLKYQIVADICNTLNISTPTQMRWIAGIGIVFLFIFINLLKLIIRYLTLRDSAKIQTCMTTALFSHFLHKDYLFHVENNSAVIREKTFSELRWVCLSFQTFLMMNSSIFITICICSLLIIVNPYLAIGSGLTLGIIYQIIYVSVRKRLSSYGQQRLDMNTLSSRIFNEAFNGIVDVKIFGREQQFIKKLDQSRTQLYNCEAKTGFISVAPRFVIEAVVMSITIIFLIIGSQIYGSFTEAAPVLGLYVVGALRVMPAVQGIFSNAANIKANSAAINNIINDTLDSLQQQMRQDSCKEETIAPIPFEQNFEFKNITFSYKKEFEPVLKDISFTIPKNHTIGFAGGSGSGKTTAVGIIIGFLSAQSGEVIVDGQTITGESIKAWQKRIGYVPQMIYMADTTIAENIAFGADIDDEKLREVARLAELEDFIESLPRQYETIIGENGVQISGGQRQRIGIARALYNNPDVIIFDEATSALDGMTEDAIMSSIHKISNDKTIIMIAHRLTTLKECNNILFFSKGKIIDSGTYEQLLQSNQQFRNMAKV